MSSDKTAAVQLTLGLTSVSPENFHQPEAANLSRPRSSTPTFYLHCTRCVMGQLTLGPESSIADGTQHGWLWITSSWLNFLFFLASAITTTVIHSDNSRMIYGGFKSNNAYIYRYILLLENARLCFEATTSCGVVVRCGDQAGSGVLLAASAASPTRPIAGLHVPSPDKQISIKLPLIMT